MHYKLTVSGGFAGMSREYQGDLSLPEDEELELTEVIREFDSLPKNKNLRDSFYYDLTIESGDEKIQGKFDDLNVPAEVSRLISVIRDKHKKNQSGKK